MRLKYCILLLCVATNLWAAAPNKKEDLKQLKRKQEFNAWFLRGRNATGALNPAGLRLNAINQGLRGPLRFGAAGMLSPMSAPVPSGGGWTELGPAPINQLSGGGPATGRITSLVLDLVHDPSANTLYVGAAYGGVWKTTNALAASPTYSPLSDSLQSLAVGCIALDSSTNSPILYVGTGEPNLSGDSYYGVGIYKSSNGGSTWSLASSADSGANPFLGLSISDIKVDPSNHNIVLAAAGRTGMAYWTSAPPQRGIFRSTDAGSTWSLVSNTAGCTSLAYDATIPAAYYAAISGRGIIKSTNQGATWSAAISPFPSHTAASASNFDRGMLTTRSGTLYCIVGEASALSAPGVGDTGLSQSTDGGSTWTAIGLLGLTNNDMAQADYNIFIAAPPASAGLVIGLIDVFRTSVISTLSSWTNVTNAYTTGTVHPDEHAIAMKDASHWFIGNDGGVWYMANSGTAWTNLNTNLGITQFTSVSPDYFHSDTWFGGSQDNGTESSSSSSASAWAQIFGGDGGYTAASPSTDHQWFTELYGVNLYRSDNAGVSFNSVMSSNTETSAFYVPYELVPGAPSTVLLGAQHIWRGPASPASPGRGWSAISADLGAPVAALDMAVSNSNVAFAVTEADPVNNIPSHVFKSSNAQGASPSWTDCTGSLPGSPYVLSCVAVNPQNPQNVFVGVQGFGVGHVYMSNDGGANWTNISGNLPDVPVNWITFDPLWPSYVYVASDMGVYFMTDGGAAGSSEVWQQMGTGLPYTTVFQVKVGAQYPRQLVAATHGRGAWSIPALIPPTPTATPSFTASPTASQTPTATLTFTITPTATPTPTATESFTVSPTFTISPTPSITPTLSVKRAPAGSSAKALLYPVPCRRGQPLCLGLANPFDSFARIRIYTLNAELVMSTDLNQANPCVSTDNMASGIYFVRLEMVSGDSVMQKLAILPP